MAIAAFFSEQDLYYLTCPLVSAVWMPVPQNPGLLMTVNKIPRLFFGHLAFTISTIRTAPKTEVFINVPFTSHEYFRQ